MRLLLASIVIIFFSSSTKNEKGKWISLFDGKSLDGWKVGHNASSFKTEDGAIVVNGDVAHLFYDGPVHQHDFKNFELKLDIMTTPGSNSGVYFHTQYQESGWPQIGYETQVNNSHADWRRTGSLWAIQDIKEVYTKDNEWFTLRIKVKSKRITVFINDKKVVDYTEAGHVKREEGLKQRVLSSGTFALQAHDPQSRVYYKNIMVKAPKD
jgi:hypothetical protein